MELKVRHYHAKQGNEMSSELPDNHGAIDDLISLSASNPRSDSLIDTLRISDTFLLVPMILVGMFISQLR
jgi:hypothetical protein